MGESSQPGSEYSTPATIGTPSATRRPFIFNSSGRETLAPNRSGSNQGRGLGMEARRRPCNLLMVSAPVHTGGRPQLRERRFAEFPLAAAGVPRFVQRRHRFECGCRSFVYLVRPSAFGLSAVGAERDDMFRSASWKRSFAAVRSSLECSHCTWHGAGPLSSTKTTAALNTARTAACAAPSADRQHSKKAFEGKRLPL